MWAHLLNLAETITNLYAKVQIANTQWERGCATCVALCGSRLVSVPVWLSGTYAGNFVQFCLLFVYETSHVTSSHAAGALNRAPGSKWACRHQHQHWHSHQQQQQKQQQQWHLLMPVAVVAGVLSATFRQIENVAIVKWHVTCQAIGHRKCPPQRLLSCFLGQKVGDLFSGPNCRRRWLLTFGCLFLCSTCRRMHIHCAIEKTQLCLPTQQILLCFPTTFTNRK